jgi:hypothetical protein
MPTHVLTNADNGTLIETSPGAITSLRLTTAPSQYERVDFDNDTGMFSAGATSFVDPGPASAPFGRPVHSFRYTGPRCGRRVATRDAPGSVKRSHSPFNMTGSCARAFLQRLRSPSRLSHEHTRRNSENYLGSGR